MNQPSHVLQHSPNVRKGSLYAILAFFFMALFGIFTKIASETGDFIWVSFITYLAATISTSIFILPKGISALQSQHYPELIARAVIGTIASFLYMFSIKYISLVNSTLLFNTAPIFIPILSVLALKLHEDKQIWLAVIIGFIGIVVIIKPNTEIFTNPGNLIGLFAGFSLAVAYMFMKFLTASDMGLRIIFYYFTIGMLMQIPLLFFTNTLPPSHAIIYSILCGIALMLAQLALVKAYTYASASQVGIYQYTTIVFVALIEWLIASKIPTLSDYIGFILVSIAGIFIIVSKPSKIKS